MSTLFTNIGDRLRKARNRTGYTQSKVAAKLDIADRTYKFYELGRREIPISTALKFCEICEVDPQWLILGEGAMHITNNADMTAKAIQALLQAMNATITVNNKPLAINQLAKQISYLIKQVTEKDTSFEEEATLLANIIIN